MLHDSFQYCLAHCFGVLLSPFVSTHWNRKDKCMMIEKTANKPSHHMALAYVGNKISISQALSFFCVLPLNNLIPVGLQCNLCLWLVWFLTLYECLEAYDKACTLQISFFNLSVWLSLLPLAMSYSTYINLPQIVSWLPNIIWAP